MSDPLPNPFSSAVLHSSTLPSSPRGTGAEETAAAVVGDAPTVAATSRFKPDMNRLYLDIVSMSQPQPLLMPLFLRNPSPEYIRACFGDRGRFIDPETGSDRRFD